MNILFVSNDPSIFDEHSPTRARMREYAAAFGELHIVSRSRRSAAAVADGPLFLYPVRTTKLGALFALPRAARRIVLAHGIEVVSAQDPFECGLAALRAVRGTSAKLHIQVHTDFLSPWFVRAGVFRSPRIRVPLFNHIRRSIADRVLPRADGVRTVSMRVRESLVRRYGSRIPEPSVIPLTVDARTPEAVPLPPHAFSFTLLTASRLEPEKRVDDIIYALARIGYRYSGVGLVVVGEGSERSRLARLARHLGLEHRVVFAGWRADQRGLMRSANAYIQASAYEGYGRSLVEAALARIPIITTDVGIVGDVFRGYEEVLAAPPGDPAALATHIIGLVEDHQARELLARAAEDAARAHLARYPDLAGMIRDDLARTLTPAA